MTLDAEIVRLARDRISLEIKDQNARLEAEISRVKAEYFSKGILHSSMFIDRVVTICASATRDRSQLAWQTLHRFATTGGVTCSDTLAGDPSHDQLKVGTLAAILGDVAEHLKVSREELLRRLFG
jgi:hypothetical protein